jgi:hypothetical protein
MYVENLNKSCWESIVVKNIFMSTLLDIFSHESCFEQWQCFGHTWKASKRCSIILTRQNVQFYDMIYLLTAIRLPPGGSSTVHIYTQTIHRTTQNKQYIERHKNIGRVRAVPSLCGVYPSICLKTEEKARKTLIQGSWRVPAGTMKIHKHTISIHRHSNKNT